MKPKKKIPSESFSKLYYRNSADTGYARLGVEHTFIIKHLLHAEYIAMNKADQVPGCTGRGTLQTRARQRHRGL